MGLTKNVIPSCHLHHLRVISILLVGYGCPVVGSPKAPRFGPQVSRGQKYGQAAEAQVPAKWPFWQCEVCDPQNGTKHGNGGIATKCPSFFFRVKSCSYFKQLDLIWNVKPSFFLLGGFMVLFTHSSR